jgi:hypothetical protein
MKIFGFNFILGQTVHSIDLKLSATKKLGGRFVVQTYHFDLQQVINNDFTMDKENCLDCPFSFNQNDGKSGGCYTHKGLMLYGLKSKLRSLNKRYKLGLLGKNYNDVLSLLNKYADKLSAKNMDISLVRFGSYGEAVTLPLDLLNGLSKLAKRKTGYTHQWNKPEFKEYAKLLMASTHNIFEAKIANDLGFRTFNVGTIENSIMCPSSPTIQKDKRVSCANCGLCAGNSISAKNIYIPKH